MTKQPLLFSLLFLACWTTPRECYAANAGVQSNFGDKTFAGGMAWEPLQDLLYITGQLGPNGCWVGILKRSSMQFLSKVVLPEPAICQGIMLADSTKLALVLATTEEGGLFTDTRYKGSTKATQYGLVVPVEWKDGQGTKVTLPKGLLLHEDQVQYPRSLVRDPVHNGEYVFVASMHSDSKQLTESFKGMSDSTPNLTPGGVFKFGTQYFLHIERIGLNLLAVGDGDDPQDVLLKAGWRKPFGLSSSTAQQQHSYSILLGNMIWNQGALVVAGSTRGGGNLFGTAQEMDGNATEYNKRTFQYCMNGFLSKVDPTNGQPWKLPTSTSSSRGEGIQRYSIGSDTDTYIEAVCSAGDSATELYIVGRHVNLENANSKSVAFMAQLDATTLETLWHEDYLFTDNAFGLACGVGVADNSDFVYMAGIVENGGSYRGQTTSLGQDDIFIVKAQVRDGHTLWVRQVGTQGNDRLAHGGSGLVAVDNGAILFGDTTGDLQTTNHKGTEIFVVAIQDDGSVLWTTTETSGSENNGGSAQILVPKRTDTASESDGMGGGHPAPPNRPIIDNTGNGDGIGMVVGIAVLILVLVVGYCLRSRKQEKVTERALVFSYLHAFDLEDVEVRHSATGGWHGTYVGQLAKGKGLGTSNEPRLSHSSIVKDSLFVDYETPRRRHRPDDDDEEEDDPDSNILEDPNFRIGSEEESDDDDDFDDDDFEDIGRLEQQLSSGQGKDETKPWGKDII